MKTAYKYDEITGGITPTRASINSSTGQPNPIKSASWEPPPGTEPQLDHIWGLKGEDTRDSEWAEAPLCWPHNAEGRPHEQPAPSLWRDGAWVPQPSTIQGEPPGPEEGHQVLAQDGAWVQVALPEPEPVELGPEPRRASINALSAGTPANEVFSWMAILGMQSPAVGTARGDINMNLLSLDSLWLAGPEGRAMAAGGLDAALAMLWGSVGEANIPEGYRAIVDAWRDEFRLRAE